MQSQELLNLLIQAAARQNLKSFEDILNSDQIEPLRQRFLDAVCLEISQTNAAWEPGRPVHERTLVRGKDFHEFYKNGWDDNWYHDDNEIICEDMEGRWVLEDDRLYDLGQLGWCVWQGSTDLHPSGYMVPVWEHFRDWAKTRNAAAATTTEKGGLS